MECTEVVNVQDVEITDYLLGAVVGILVVGLMIATIIIIVVVCVCFRKYICRKGRCCAACACCCCCWFFLGTGDDNEDEYYLLHSWEEPDSQAPPQSDPAMGLQVIQDYEYYQEGPLPPKKSFSEFTLNIGDSLLDIMSGGDSSNTALLNKDESLSSEVRAEAIAAANINTTSIAGTMALTSARDIMATASDDIVATASDGGIMTALTAGTSSHVMQATIKSQQTIINDELKDNIEFNFIDIFTASSWQQHYILYCCESEDILKLEEEFHTHWIEYFITMLEVVTIKIVKEDKASEEWKNAVVSTCAESLSNARKDHVLLVARKQKGNIETQIISLECSIKSMYIRVFDIIQASFKDLNLPLLEAQEVTTSLRKNLEKFERLLFDIYLEETKNLTKKICQREAFMEKTIGNIEMIIKAINLHQRKHVEELINFETISRETSHQESIIAAKVERIWIDTINEYKKVFMERKANMNSSDKEKENTREKFDFAIQVQKEKLINGKSVNTYAKFYCRKVKKLVDIENKSDCNEILEIAKELSAVVEVLGTDLLQKGLKEESHIYTEIISSTNLSSDTNNMILQLKADLETLQTNIKALQLRQESDLQSFMNDGPHEPSDETEYFSEITIEDNYIQTFLDAHLELSDKDRKELSERLSTEIKCYQLHLMLSKLNQERRLKHEYADGKAKFLALKKSLSQDAEIEGGVQATIELSQEEKAFDASHNEQVELIRRMLAECVLSSKSNIKALCQIELEKIQHVHKRGSSKIAGSQQKVISTQKNIPLIAISEEDKLLQEHQINVNTLDEDMLRSRHHQEQILQQKIQARKLERIEEGKQLKKQRPLYNVGSIHRFAANCWVSLFLKVRHQRNVQELEEFYRVEGEKLKKVLKKRYEVNTKHSVQFHEKELIVKLAAALKMTSQGLKKELDLSMSGAQ